MTKLLVFALYYNTKYRITKTMYILHLNNNPDIQYIMLQTQLHYVTQSSKFQRLDFVLITTSSYKQFYWH